MNNKNLMFSRNVVHAAWGTMLAALAIPAMAADMTSCAGKAPSGELRAERVAAAAPSREGASLYEGPVWIGGALYFSDFGLEGTFPSRIRKLAPDGSVGTAFEDSGSNGLAVDGAGKLVAASHKDKALVRIDLANGKRTPIAGRYDGQPFNSPNDIAIARDGTLYFTDPDYQQAAAPGRQGVTGIYRVGTDGKAALLDGSRKNPNGIALSPDEKVLYVNALDGVLRAYPVVDGAARLPGRDVVKGLDGPDGMTVDCQGNVYVTEHAARRVRVFSPQGRELATIRVDANVTNAAFGGGDGKTLYITGAGALWQVRLGLPGKPY
ncbi:SMP-30/gluconolactonase/LRE family protein [Massilia sp. YIM B02763]|uniref:SMP-30/gluconolactonase/LRE family protein n=1 Tax=Massilia sp. YIM B02763 TaxID=3050130 RepID=UPI0025B69F7D|nr:SMP-30/gluconolactonase/LRE family protein [Massilia sp. YIM B02763]MDN4055085.1 SMP-30/gluconolactonase/LRE family protein [Massilia sp. YIM B02763]